MKKQKISVNKIAEYLSADVLRRKTIIQNQKVPPTFKTQPYSKARKFGVELLAEAITPIELSNIVSQLQSLPAAREFERRNNKLSAEALSAFLKSYKSIMQSLSIGERFEKVPTNAEIDIEVNELIISLRPDALIKDENSKVVGFVKFHFSKKNCLDTSAREIVAMTIRKYYEDEKSFSSTTNV